MKKRNVLFASSAVVLIIILGIPSFILLSSTFSYQLKSLNSSINECIKSEAEKAFFISGIQGGYLFPDKYIVLGDFNISYLHYQGEDLLSPFLVKEQLAASIKNGLLNCIDFNRFESKGLSIESREIALNLDFEKNFTSLNVTWPIAVGKGKKSALLENFSMVFPITLEKIYDLSKDIINQEIENPELIDSTLLLDIEANNKGINIILLPYQNDTLIYLITDSDSSIYDNPYVFMFASKH